MDPVLCRVCGMAFSNRSSLRQHELKHTKQSPYICCNKHFFSKATLKRHRCHQHGEVCQYVRETCGKGFAIQTDLRRHKAREAGMLKLNCDVCGFKAECQGTMTDHITMHMGTEESKRHRCSVCSKCFRFQSNLSRHLKIHSEEIYNCTACDKTFSSAITLRVHAKTHTRREQCPVCQNNYSAKYLKIHMKKHNA